ncbi:MAG: hypothetical protein CME71_09405 [Halobacteriovorax sp.]|nr:hypothetical protein [Halobacteriovorax sp.]
MIYLLFKKQWVEHEPEYLSHEQEAVRLEPTLLGAKKSNIKNQRFRIQDGKPVLSIGDIMSRELLHVTHNTPLKVCGSIMKNESVHHLAVFNDGHFCGLISDRDILFARNNDSSAKANADSVATTVVMAIHESAPAGITAKVLLQEGINALPVLDDDLNICGIVTTRDFLRVLSGLIH